MIPWHPGIDEKHGYASGGLVLIDFYPGDDEEALLRERFCPDGPPLGVMVILIRKFAARSEPAEAA